MLLYMAMEPINTHAHAWQNFTSKRQVLVSPLHKKVMQNKIVCSTHINEAGEAMVPI